MKQRFAASMCGFVGAVMLTATATSMAAQPFEGAITMRMNTGRAAAGAPNPEIQYLVRGENLRVTMSGPAGGMSMLALAGEKKMYMVVDAQRSYMEIPASGMQASMDSRAPATLAVTRTGKRETIAGVECEHVLVADQGQQIDVCVSKALGGFLNPLTSMRQGPAPAWQRTLAADGGFPLRVTGPDGAVMLEVTKVERKSLAPALFIIPDSYSRMTAPRR